MPEKPITTEHATCPECGQDLMGRDPWAHALDHWPEVIPEGAQYAQAKARQTQLKKLAEKWGYS